MSSPPPIDRHNEEIQENLRHWRRKPLLQKQYARFYGEIAAALAGIPDAPVLECGSGIGNLKSALPNAITSDLFPNPWLDRRENVYALSFPDASLGAIVLFDVFHHLQYPGTALDEIHRVLKPGGRLAIFDPAMGLLGRIVLGLFHHEPLALGQRIDWTAPPATDLTSVPYYAAQGNAWRVFAPGHNQIADRLSLWKRNLVQYYPAFPWLLTGGFRGPSFCPPWLESTATLIERGLSLCPRLFASRMLVVLEKPRS